MVATLRALVRVGDKTSGDARSCMSLEQLMKSISETCSKSDTLRWIAKRVSDSRTAGVKVVASVIPGVRIGVKCGGIVMNGGMSGDIVVTGASVMISRIDERTVGSGITKTGTVSSDEDWIFRTSC
ncbi:hypothetical protein Tco_0885577 [Tanacetum coccineum]